MWAKALAVAATKEKGSSQGPSGAPTDGFNTYPERRLLQNRFGPSPPIKTTALVGLGFLVSIYIPEELQRFPQEKKELQRALLLLRSCVLFKKGVL